MKPDPASLPSPAGTHPGDVSAIPHGGDLGDAARLAGSAAAAAHGWLDLSTGINPHTFPAVHDAAALKRLPQRADEDRLIAAARRAYRVPDDAAILAAPGTQAIIQWLPHVLPADRVTVLGPTYAEHAAVWSRHAPTTEAATLPTDGLAVVVNPNNPTGRVVPQDTLAAFASAGAPGTVRLVVDEAFGDLTPDVSAAGLPGTIVLKSFGKFYGLPGLRLGFAIGPAPVIARLAEAIGPWAVPAPALVTGAAALADDAWATAMRARLTREAAELDTVLTAAGLTVVGGTALFRLVETPDAAALQRALARHAIWTRAFPYAPTWLRIGLPGPHLPRLEAALAAVAARPDNA